MKDWLVVIGGGAALAVCALCATAFAITLAALPWAMFVAAIYWLLRLFGVVG